MTSYGFKKQNGRIFTMKRIKPPRVFSSFTVMKLLDFNPDSIHTFPDIPDPKDLKRETAGFVHVADNLPHHTANGNHMFHLRIKTKKLPPSVLSKEIKIKVEQWETTLNREASGQEIDKLSKEVELNLLERAFVIDKTIRILVLVNKALNGGHLLVVETTSVSEIDTVNHMVRLMLGNQVYIDKEFGTKMFDNICNDVNCYQNIRLNGACKWKGQDKNDKRTVALTEFELSTAFMRYWVYDEDLMLTSLDFACAALNENQETEQFVTCSLNDKGCFSKVKYMQNPEYSQSRNHSAIEQANIEYMSQFIPLILLIVQHPFVFDEI